MSSSERRQRVRSECQEFIIAAKAKPCELCGQWYPTVCMDFDHLPGYEKSFNIGTPSNWTAVNRIKSEIRKTQVICSNCHRIVTWERKHGRKVEYPAGFSGRQDRAEPSQSCVHGDPEVRAVPADGRPAERPEKVWRRALTLLLEYSRVWI